MTDLAPTDDAPGSHALAYIAGLAPSARGSMAASLDRAAAIVAGHPTSGTEYPWAFRPTATLRALRAALAERYAVSTANHSLAAVRGVLRAAWLAGRKAGGQEAEALAFHGKVDAVPGGARRGVYEGVPRLA